MVEQQIEFAAEQGWKITTQICDVNNEIKRADDVEKKASQLEFERAQVELQEQHERHGWAEQLQKKPSFWTKNSSTESHSTSRNLLVFLQAIVAFKTTGLQPNFQNYR